MLDKVRDRDEARSLTETSHRADIDGLRAVAILGVLAYHFGLGVPGGYGGVDVFFVISGFLIAGIIKRELEAGTFSLANFYVRRIRRILPALTVCLAVTTAAAIFILFPADLVSFGKSLRAVVLWTANFQFMRESTNYFGDVNGDPLLHTWSLSIEEQFYVALPLMLIVLSRWAERAIFPVLVIVALLSFAASVRGVAISPERAFFSTTGRSWELLVGVVLAVGRFPILAGRWRELEAAGGIAMIVAGYFIYSEETPFPGLAALPFCLGAAFVIHSGAGTGTQRSTLVGRALSSRVPVGLGLISYSVYLWHWPLLVLARYRFPEMFEPSVASVPTMITLAMVSVLAGYLSWAFVENPFRRKRSFSLPLAFGGAAVVVAGALAVAATIISAPNVLGRWPDAIAAMADPKHRLKPARDFGKELSGADGQGTGTYEVGIGASTKTLLWGDSHMLALLPGVAAYLNTAGRSALVAPHPNCPPLLHLDFGERLGWCGRANERTATAIQSDPTVTRVVLVSRWANIAQAVRRDDRGRPTYRKGNRDARAFAEALVESVKVFLSSGKEVVLVGPIPEHPFDIAAATARHEAWGAPLPAEVPVAAFMTRQKLVLELLAKLDDLPNVRVVYPHAILCPSATCRYRDGDKALYVDRDHLSADGAIALASMFGDIFNLPGEAEQP